MHLNNSEGPVEDIDSKIKPDIDSKIKPVGLASDRTAADPKVTQYFRGHRRPHGNFNWKHNSVKLRIGNSLKIFHTPILDSTPLFPPP
jgi:hypothetical protein